MSTRGVLPALLMAVSLPSMAAAQPWVRQIALTPVSTPAAVASAPATVAVMLPAEADLWFDGVAMARRGAVRTFTTPPLVPGASYAYEVTARWPGRGRDVVRVERVVVRAGERVTVDLTAVEDRRAVGVAHMVVEDLKGRPQPGGVTRAVGFQVIREFAKTEKADKAGKGAAVKPPEHVPGFMSVVTFEK